MRGKDIVGVPVAAEVLARALARHPNFRIQTLIEPMERREPGFRRTDELSIAVLDVETTGLDWRTDKIIELAVQNVSVDAHGRIVSTGKPHGWFEDPGLPIPPLIAGMTGISDEMVVGKSIPEGEAYALITSADIVLSHNAAFDRPFIEKRLDISGQAWVCSLMDIDWRAHGFQKRSLEDLLLRCGWFFHAAHRATADVNALLHLLDYKLESGRTVLKELLVNAARPTWRIEARNAPFEGKDLLRERRYIWDPTQKFWWRHATDDEVLHEREWLAEHVYDAGKEPVVAKVTWRERYGAPRE